MALDIYQEAFSLCMLADNVTTVKGVKGQDNQAKLQQWLNATHHISLAESGVSKGWVPVFGPAVWTHPDGNDADNTWFIYHNPAAQFEDGPHDTYILAIAGTVTKYDWEDEDFSVVSVVDFDQWMNKGINSDPDPEWWWVYDNKNPYISWGTAQGMQVILNTPAPPTTPGAGKNIVQFIAALPSTARLVITGHSLGSALCTGIACALKKCGKLETLEKTLVYPSAGPSPGNALFANYFAQSFPATPKPTSGYKVWNANIWNTKDIVPHAWSKTYPNQNLGGIVDIWPMGGVARATLVTAVAAADGLVAVSEISYVPLQSYSFVGEGPSIAKANSEADLYANAYEEHIGAYKKFFSLPPTKFEASLQLAKFGLHLKAKKEIVEDRPFLELLRRVTDNPDKAAQAVQAVQARRAARKAQAAKAGGEATA